MEAFQRVMGPVVLLGLFSLFLMLLVSILFCSDLFGPALFYMDVCYAFLLGSMYAPVLAIFAHSVVSQSLCLCLAYIN